FMPEALFNMFYEINLSNEVLIKQIEENRYSEIQVVTTGKIRPTRKSVIDQGKYSINVGGVNYFPPVPDQTNASDIDQILASYDENKKMHDISYEQAEKILQKLKSDMSVRWSIPAFVNALQACKAAKGMPDIVKLIVRRNRNISKGTGTLLSQDDRKLGDDIQNLPVITLYRLNGQDRGWEGNPFWIPNIKLPGGKVFHRVE
ncbi:MAG TPA: hypothetical protein PK263_02855, partial [bacterium]|nr:hypothetical protein [bacterium]